MFCLWSWSACSLLIPVVVCYCYCCFLLLLLLFTSLYNLLWAFSLFKLILSLFELYADKLRWFVLFLYLLISWSVWACNLLLLLYFVVSWLFVKTHLSFLAYLCALGSLQKENKILKNHINQFESWIHVEIWVRFTNPWLKSVFKKGVQFVVVFVCNPETVNKKKK